MIFIVNILSPVGVWEDLNILPTFVQELLETAVLTSCLLSWMKKDFKKGVVLKM